MTARISAALIGAAILASTLGQPRPAAAAVRQAAKAHGEVQPDQALVYFIREGRFVGSGRTMFVYADDFFVGTLDNDSYTFAQLAPGKHLLWLNWAKVSSEVELAAGREYYFTVWDRFIEIDAESGKAFVEAVKSYVTPAPKETETSAEHIRERYGKAQKIAAERPEGMPAHAGSETKREEHVAQWPKVDLAPYGVLVVEDFTMADPKAGERKKEHLIETAPRRLPELVVKDLGEGVFGEVRRGTADPAAGTLVLRARITQYKPGSETARFMLAGAGSAQLELEAQLVDAASGAEVCHFAADRTWAWGGALGASRGIEEIERNLAYEIALYLKRGKGIEPAE